MRHNLLSRGKYGHMRENETNLLMWYIKHSLLLILFRAWLINITTPPESLGLVQGHFWSVSNLLINISHPAAASESRGEMVEMWERPTGGREGDYAVSYGLTHINTPRAWDVPARAGPLLFLDRHPTTWTLWWWRRLATSKPAARLKPHYRAGLRFDLSK